MAARSFLMRWPSSQMTTSGPGLTSAASASAMSAGLRAAGSSSSSSSSSAAGVPAPDVLLLAAAFFFFYGWKMEDRRSACVQLHQPRAHLLGGTCSGEKLAQHFIADNERATLVFPRAQHGQAVFKTCLQHRIHVGPRAGRQPWDYSATVRCAYAGIPLLPFNAFPKKN